MASPVQTTPIEFRPGDPDFTRSPFETYRQLRDHDPVHHHVDDHADYWVLSRFDDVFAAARDAETFSSAQGLSLDGGDIEMLGLLPTVVMMDPPAHTAFRRLVSRGFTPRKVAEIEPDLRSFVVGRLDAMEQALATDGRADFIDAFASPVPSFVVATYLGVPEADRHRFDAWSSAIVSAGAAGDVLAGAQDAVGELYEYFRDLIALRREQPADDMISGLAHATVDDGEVPIESILGYAFVMIAGGNDTATGLLGGAAELLTGRRDQRARLVDQPDLIPGAVEELLRLTSPVQGLSRVATASTIVRGVDIPAGARVHLLYASANRDEREFGPDAETLDVTRSIARFMTFTSGPHYCLGAAAARLQGRVALEELLRRFPDFEVHPDEGHYAPGAFVRRFESLPITVR